MGGVGWRSEEGLTLVSGSAGGQHDALDDVPRTGPRTRQQDELSEEIIHVD
jgi:hypothetical protein